MENTHKTSASSSRTDRKVIERNRRNRMKSLYFKLNSLVTDQSSREMTSLPDQLEEAEEYIKRLQMNLEKMRQEKERLMVMGSNVKRVQVKIHEMAGSGLEVVFVTSWSTESHSIFSQAVQVIEEEGAEIVNASYSAVEENVFYTMHCKAGELAPGYVAARISQRLQKLFTYDSIIDIVVG